jgi:receptor protein-tyrosine kinase
VEVDLREAVSALRSSWWLPVVGLLFGGGVTLAFCLAQTPKYTSNAQVFISTTDTRSTADAFQGGQFSQQRVTSYAKLLTGEQLAGRVVQRLHLPMTPRQLAAEVSATAATQTVLIDITVTDPSPERAQEIGNALLEQFSKVVVDLETPAAGGPSPVKVSITEAPDLATTPSSPRTVTDTAAGAVAGLVLGALGALARARLDRTVTETAEAAELTGAPVIGAITRDPALEKEHTIPRGTASRAAENYRQLRTNLQFLNVDDPPRVLMVTSAVEAEGKTTLVINLALALTEMGRRVTIVEADLRRPKVTRYLGMVEGTGLTNILAGTVDFDEVVQPYGDGQLRVVAAGPKPPNPGELLASSQMAALLGKLRGSNDFVLVDSPPLLPVADSTGLAVFVDGVLLSVRYGSTRREQLQQAGTALERVGARTLGVVLNLVPPRADPVYGYGYGQGDGTAGRHAGR